MNKPIPDTSWKERVFSLVGEASMTFKTEAGNEVFDSSTAERIANDLIAITEDYARDCLDYCRPEEVKGVPGNGYMFGWNESISDSLKKQKELGL